jgi:regulator of cell morphogenesis and NO signaling
MTTTDRPIPRLDPASLVNDVLRHHPTTARVFNDFGIDACCGGARTLIDAAREDGADCCALLGALEWAMAEAEATA